MCLYIFGIYFFKKWTGMRNQKAEKKNTHVAEGNRAGTIRTETRLVFYIFKKINYKKFQGIPSD